MPAIQTYSQGGLTIHFPSRDVEVDGRSIPLTNTEYRLLYHLVRNAGRIVTHHELLQSAWGSANYGEDVVRVYVSRLRAKIETDTARPRFYVTRSGLGYLFAGDGVSDDQADAGGTGEPFRSDVKKHERDRPFWSRAPGGRSGRTRYPFRPRRGDAGVSPRRRPHSLTLALLPARKESSLVRARILSCWLMPRSGKPRAGYAATDCSDRGRCCSEGMKVDRFHAVSVVSAAR